MKQYPLLLLACIATQLYSSQSSKTVPGGLSRIESYVMLLFDPKLSDVKASAFRWIREREQENAAPRLSSGKTVPSGEEIGVTLPPGKDTPSKNDEKALLRLPAGKTVPPQPSY